MTQYLIRVTDIPERTTFDVEQIALDTIEECQERAVIFRDQCFPLTWAATKTTILMKPEPMIDRWAINCWRLAEGEWIYPGDDSDIL